MNWQPGDRALFLAKPNTQDALGISGEIVTLSHRVTMSNGRDGWNIGGIHRVAEHCLHPIYDGNETVSWESCIWEPSPVVTI